MSVQTRTNPKTGKKTYIVRWRGGPPPHSRTFDRKGDADRFDAEIKRRKQLGPLAITELTSPDTTTLNEWIATRWGPEHASTLAENTRETYTQIYKKHIAPHLATIALRDLTVSRLRIWQQERIADDIGPAALDYARALLSSVLRHAAEAEAIAANPMSLVRAPKSARPDEVVPLSPITIEAMRSVLEPRDATLLSVLAYAGLRPGEALDLQWQHLRDRTLLVWASKTHGYRPVKLLLPLLQDLRAWKLATSHPTGPDDLIFPDATGGRWATNAYKSWARQETTTRHKLKNGQERPNRPAGPFHRAIAAAAGPAEATPYSLRHSFASLLLAEHKTIHYVAEQLGNSPEMVLKVYGHVIAEYADAGPIDAAHEIEKARQPTSSALRVHQEAR